MSTTNYGLREKHHDGTEFAVGAFIQFPSLNTLPKVFELGIPPEWIRTQRYDTCSAEAFGNLLSHLNQVKIDALYAWVLARMNNGYATTDWGVDLKAIAMAIVKGGAPDFKDSQYHSDADRDVFADIVNWDLKATQSKAMANKAGSAIEVSPINGADYFDSIKMTLHKLQSPVVIGVMWNWLPDNPLIEGIQTAGYGHALICVGWTEDRLIILNSWGDHVGDKGYYYFPRDVINHDVVIFGAWTLVDETPEKVRWYIENGIYLNDGNWLLNIVKALFVAVKGRLKIAQDASKPVTPIGVPPYPSKVTRYCEAIRAHEGWFPSSRSRRNHNPGNFKYIGQYKAIGKDAQGFAIFPDDETGWQHLLRVVYNACSGKSLMYPSTMTIYEYFAKYAPASDDNDSKRYAEVVAEACGVSPYSKLNELL